METKKCAFNSQEGRAKAQVARAAAMLRRKKGPVISPERQAAIDKRHNEMPQTYRKIYLKAVHCKSMRAALTAFCLECVIDQRIEIQKCTDLGCPLWGYRPYQKSIDEDVDEKS